MSSIHQKILIITAPSGAGKTSITHHLMNSFPVLAFSVSAATRQARNNEKEGVDYYFMSVEDFKQKIRRKILNMAEQANDEIFPKLLESKILESKQKYSNTVVKIAQLISDLEKFHSQHRIVF